jgi:pyridoxamine 5'-phosphate oxidase family protein
MSFTDEEVAYLRSQRLCRIATVSSDGQPDVVPVGYEFDGTYIYVGGLDPAKTRKFRNVRAGNDKVALVIDDLISAQPWTPRYLRIYGTVELVERAGQFGSAPYMRITPTTSWSWNLEGRPFTHDREVAVHRTVHRSAGPRTERRPAMRSPIDQVHDWNRKTIEEFRANSGRVGGNFAGAPLLLLHTIGARSGKERINPMMYQDVGDGRVAVFASKAGEPTHPDWYHNLVANPDVTAEIGTEIQHFRARTATPGEREPIWAKQKRDYPGFAGYEAKTDRRIPVVILDPV